MLNISLNLIGIILIIYSIFIIKNDIFKNNIKLEDLTLIEENVKHYYDSTNDIIKSFNELVELKLEEIHRQTKQEDDILNNGNKNTAKVNKCPLEINNTNKKKTDPVQEKIIELLGIGLTKEEIAKKMNKGIREVEIIIKMYNK